MKARSFSHVGITVSDFNRAVPLLLGRVRLPAGRRGRRAARARPRVLRRRRARSRPARSAGFASPAARCSRFSTSSRSSRRVPIPWNRVGLTHISLNVRNLQRWHDYLVSKGVECVSQPEQSPRGHSFFFAKDFDGNLIEITDLGLHVPRARLARSARRLGVQARDVQEILRDVFGLRSSVSGLRSSWTADRRP